ncbi:nucleotidyltransferase domain-containing protein [Candidatus Fermentibacteria bacterium]|nr:nucleotidyltransferase domain-containing protein [Candidatus Fermentibacteria bacterium]
MTAYLISRDAIIETLKKDLKPREYVRAAWLGGSDATGRTDQWSDVDLLLIVEDHAVEQTADTVISALARLGPIAHRYRLPEPTPHGHLQEFISLRDADPCHLLDYVVMKRSSGGWFLEPERHGDQLVLFDKDGLVKPAPFDWTAHKAKMMRRIEALREIFPLFQSFVLKAVFRGDLADAWYSYFACTLRPLVELARMRHCPDRFDYGFRYFDRDLPDAVRREIESLLLPRSLEGIGALRHRAEELFNRLLEEIDTNTGEEGAP